MKITEESLKTSYKLHRFLRYYLSNTENINDFESINDDSYASMEYLDYIENILDETTPVCLSETETVIELLRNIDKANEQTIGQFEIIKEFLIENKMSEYFFKVVYILYEIYEFWFDEMCVPSRKTLFKNFGSFFTDLCKGESIRGIKTLLEEKRTMQLQIIALSARLALENFKKTRYEIKDLFDNCESAMRIENSQFARHEKISRTRIDVETKLFKKLKNVKLLPYYFSLADNDYCDTFVGNIIIIRDKNNNDFITYQIVNRMHFPSYRRMFLAINPKEFGFRHQGPEKFAEKCKEFFRKISDKEGALALEVTKIKV